MSFLNLVPLLCLFKSKGLPQASSISLDSRSMAEFLLSKVCNISFLKFDSVGVIVIIPKLGLISPTDVYGITVVGEYFFNLKFSGNFAGSNPVPPTEGCLMVNSPFLFVVSLFKRTLLTLTPGRGSLVIEFTTVPLTV